MLLRAPLSTPFSMSLHRSQKTSPGVLKGSKEGLTSKLVSVAPVEFLLDKHPCPLDEGNLVSIKLQGGQKEGTLYRWEP